MKKLFSMVLCLCICMSLSACTSGDRGSNNADDYESGYNYGFDRGYEEGLLDGAFECKDDFAEAFRSCYYDVEHATLNGRELHPEEAIMILNDYLDGEYVSSYDLETAIKVISDFYYDWQSVIANIEDLDVDVDFD